LRPVGYIKEKPFRGVVIAKSRLPSSSTDSAATLIFFLWLVLANPLLVHLCWFEVQIGEKGKSMPAFTVHQGRDFCQVSLQFILNPLI
jgi:hypothetical protein